MCRPCGRALKCSITKAPLSASCSSTSTYGPLRGTQSGSRRRRHALHRQRRGRLPRPPRPGEDLRVRPGRPPPALRRFRRRTARPTLLGRGDRPFRPLFAAGGNATRVAGRGRRATRGRAHRNRQHPEPEPRHRARRRPARCGPRLGPGSKGRPTGGGLDQARRVADDNRQAKEEFLATLSHEIRTPMNAVTGLVHALANNRPPTIRAETIASLQFASRKLIGVVNDVLDFSKIEAGKLTFHPAGLRPARAPRKHRNGQQATGGKRARSNSRSCSAPPYPSN